MDDEVALAEPWVAILRRYRFSKMTEDQQLRRGAEGFFL